MCAAMETRCFKEPGYNLGICDGSPGACSGFPVPPVDSQSGTIVVIVVVVILAGAIFAGFVVGYDYY